MPWRRTPAAKYLLLIAATILATYGLIYRDVVSRAREAYENGERYLEWNRDPAKKKADLDRRYEQEKARSERLFSKKKISETDHRRKMEALELEREFAMSESPLKYAYQWFKDAHELFSPPESKWVRMARARAPEVLALWKEELRRQNVPFEDTMFE